MHIAQKLAHTSTSSWFFSLSFSLSHFISLQFKHLLHKSYLYLFFLPKVSGESLTSSQQCPHCPLSHDALLCQPVFRKRTKFQSRGVFRYIRSAPQLNYSHLICSMTQYVSMNLKVSFITWMNARGSNNKDLEVQQFCHHLCLSLKRR